MTIEKPAGTLVEMRASQSSCENENGEDEKDLFWSKSAEKVLVFGLSNMSRELSVKMEGSPGGCGVVEACELVHSKSESSDNQSMFLSNRATSRQSRKASSQDSWADRVDVQNHLSSRIFIEERRTKTTSSQQ
eukprot:CAMPEP_0185845954 /NCGR_PEP_ID=MMETSP1354-20130828/1775_1 /TAXON_ID=708628 /ORGANISM="Erythrolobus madagascarensis, Strain CCMP3276" /LENGTH=132 /DNA_ID=CAMNT_0028546031 /DNA_START=258 /DNA_END=656 /DNA_ORIENTATION=+